MYSLVLQDTQIISVQTRESAH